MEINAYDCVLYSSPAAGIHRGGYIEILDTNNNLIGDTDGEYNFTVRPKSFEVDAGVCRYLEGMNRGSTYNLGGYIFVIPENVDSYYDLNEKYKRPYINNATSKYYNSIFFEKIDTTIEREINCQTSYIQSAAGVKDSDILYWEYFLEDKVVRINNSENTSRIPINDYQFDIDLKEYEGKKIYFRYFMVGGIHSSFIAYTIKLCSPKVRYITSIDSKCATSNDASFTITFDRNLDASKNERLLVYPEVYTGVRFEPLPGKVLSATDLPNRQYTWPRELKPGRYRVRWISKNGTSPTANPNSDEVSNEFTLKAPPPLGATTSVTQVQCFGGGNGSVTINALGGTPPYQYSGNDGVNWQTSNKITGLKAGSYSLKVKDNNGCLLALSAKVEQPASAPTIINSNSANPTSPGGSNGYINIAVSGGQSPYVFNWTKNGVPYSKSQNLTSLGKGTYEIIVSDAKGCSTASMQFVLIEPDPVSVSFSTYPSGGIVCSGERINLTAKGEGGTSSNDNSYNYKWSTGSTEETLYNVPAGTYSVTVRDKNSNSVTQSFTISEPDDFKINPNVQNVLCKGDNSGAIDLVIAGGTPPYVVKWSKFFDASFQMAGSKIESLFEGTYFYEITDSKGCTTDNFETGIKISEPSLELSAFEIKESHRENNIYGGTQGQLEILVEGGNSGYSCLWKKDGLSFTLPSGSTQFKLVNLAAGNYQAVITDAKGCTTQLLNPITITEPDKLVIEAVSHSDVTCHGTKTGSISVRPKGGIPPYTYYWTKIGDLQFKGENKPVLNNLSAGTYQVKVTDNSGSSAETLMQQEIKEPDELSISFVSSDNLCYSDTNGKIDITVFGGTPPYTYHWSNGAQTPDIDGLPSGDYMITVKDVNDCELEQTITIKQPEKALSLRTLLLKQITGYNYNDGQISVEANGGSPPYFYQWRGPDGFTSKEKNISDLLPGTYTLTITDNNAQTSQSSNCSVVEIYQIKEPEKLEVVVEETTSILCRDETSGILFANVQGGITPYSYEWYPKDGSDTPLANSAELNNVGAGEYYVRVTDNNGVAVQSEGYNLKEPEELKIVPEKIVDVLCYGASTGSIDISITGGIPPYAAEWDNGQMTEDISGLRAGSYTVLVSDSNNCWKELQLEVKNEFEALKIKDPVITNVTSYGGHDGAIAVSITGGKSPYEIKWIRSRDNTMVGNTTSINELTHGEYAISVTDANACNVTNSYIISQPDIVDAIITVPTCVNDCDGTIEVVVNKGVGTYSYTWESGERDAKISGLCAGNYTVTIVGYYNEIIKRTYELKNPEALEVNLGEDVTLCKDQSKSFDISIEDSRATYQWFSDTGFSSSAPVVTINKAGNYNVIVTDSKGCVGTDLVVVKSQPDEISAEFFVSTQVFMNEKFVAVDVSMPKPDSVEWIFPKDAKVVVRDNDNAELYFEQPGEYELSMITHLGPCIEFQTKKIIVVEPNGEETVSLNDNTTVNPKTTIEDFKVYPNPTTGNITVDVIMKESGAINLRVFNLENNMVVAQYKETGQKEYQVPLSLSGVAPGLYAVVLETPYGNAVRKLVKI